MYDHTLFRCLQITKADIRPQVNWAVDLVISDSHFNLPQGFVWVCMGSHTHFITFDSLLPHLIIIGAGANYVTPNANGHS